MNEFTFESTVNSLRAETRKLHEEIESLRTTIADQDYLIEELTTVPEPQYGIDPANVRQYPVPTTKSFYPSHFGGMMAMMQYEQERLQAMMALRKALPSTPRQEERPFQRLDRIQLDTTARVVVKSVKRNKLKFWSK